MSQATALKFHRVAPGDYQSDDPVVRIYRIPGISPPAWNAYYVDAHDNDIDIVDGAASYRDAKAIATQSFPIK